MRYLRPYHMDFRMQQGSGRHKGMRFQRGGGLGTIFSTLLRFLKPLAARGAKAAVSASKSALANPEVQSNLVKLKDTAVNRGITILNNTLGQGESAASSRKRTKPLPSLKKADKKKKVVDKKGRKTKATPRGKKKKRSGIF